VADDDWSRGKAGLQRLDLLAAAAAESTSSPWAIVVGEVQQGKDGRFVEVVVRQPDGRLERLRLGLRGRGELTRDDLTTQLLDQLRRRLR
jgi:hypothetical protein